MLTCVITSLRVKLALQREKRKNRGAQPTLSYETLGLQSQENELLTTAKNNATLPVNWI